MTHVYSSYCSRVFERLERQKSEGVCGAQHVLLRGDLPVSTAESSMRSRQKEQSTRTTGT